MPLKGSRLAVFKRWQEILSKAPASSSAFVLLNTATSSRTTRRYCSSSVETQWSVDRFLHNSSGRVDAFKGSLCVLSVSA